MFKERVSAIKEWPAEGPGVYRAKVRHDVMADQYLEQAAQAYLLGTTYAQLYSARSISLTVLYDRLYNDLKKFNVDELTAFHEKVELLRKEYPIDRAREKIDNLGDLHEFLHETFGLSL
jgi:hypothetical protein